ncbi:hypothetical protein F4778DRAFT_776601 [Xylariomycetidae sp. FL2044]|nr:hypothetical protein F4778DRAFT_776601 [Xylariomycetidae sp. FL2044]
MDLLDPSLLTGRFTTFVVSPSHKKYVVHTDVIAKLSATLSKRVNDEKMDYYIWEDIPEDVWKAFMQFAYSGRYDEVDFVDVSPRTEPLGRFHEQHVSSPSNSEDVDDDDDDGYCGVDPEWHQRFREAYPYSLDSLIHLHRQAISLFQNREAKYITGTYEPEDVTREQERDWEAFEAEIAAAKRFRD